MNPVFQIDPGYITSLQTNLFLEVSNEGLSYFFSDELNKKILGLTVFHFDKRNGELNTINVLRKIFDEQPLLTANYKKTFFSYAFSESILTPDAYYNSAENDEKINLIYGDLQEGTIITDRAEKKKIYNTYRIPQGIHEIFNGRFPAAGFAHQYTLLVDDLPLTGNLLHLIFYQNKFVLTLIKEGTLQIMQTFTYVTSEDAVYHMLNACLQMEVKEVDIKLTGMIEKESALYQEIHKYFLNIHFAGLPGELLYADGIKTFPNHFFSHLFSLALCV